MLRPSVASICVSAAVEVVRSAAARQIVVPSIAEQMIRSGSPSDDVVPTSAVQGVVRIVGGETLIERALETVVTDPAPQNVRSAPA